MGAHLWKWGCGKREVWLNELIDLTWGMELHGRERKVRRMVLQSRMWLSEL